MAFDYTTLAWPTEGYVDKRNSDYTSSGSTRVIKVPWEDRNAADAAYRGHADPWNTSLIMNEVTIKPLPAKGTPKYAELTITAAISTIVTAHLLNMPFRIQWRAYSQALTIGGGYTWASDGKPVVNKNVLPAIRTSEVSCTLSGRRSSFNINDWVGWIDTVNDAEWQGAAAGTLLFHPGPTASDSMGPTGSPVWDLEINLLYLPMGWNNFVREDGNLHFDTLVDDHGEHPYAASTFPNLTYGY